MDEMNILPRVFQNHGYYSNVSNEHRYSSGGYSSTTVESVKDEPQRGKLSQLSEQMTKLWHLWKSFLSLLCIRFWISYLWQVNCVKCNFNCMDLVWYLNWMIGNGVGTCVWIGLIKEMPNYDITHNHTWMNHSQMNLNHRASGYVTCFHYDARDYKKKKEEHLAIWSINPLTLIPLKNYPFCLNWL